AEKQAILDCHALFPLEGYRRLTFMMLDRDIVACSPSSVYRVLKAAGLLDRHTPKASSKGKGFVQPLRPQSIGTLMSRTSTSPARSTTCAACSTAVAASSSIGNCARR